MNDSGEERTLERDTPAEEVCVEPISEEYAGRILTKRNKVLANRVLGVLPVIATLGGIPLVLAGLLFLVIAMGGETNSATSIEWFISISTMCLGAFAFLAGLWNFSVNRGHLANYFILLQTRKALRDRPEVLVDPEDPRAWLVDVVLCRDGHRAMLEHATDVGSLRADEERRQILFEGDNKRCWIPAGSVRSCEIEEAYVVYGPFVESCRVIVLYCFRDGKPWEFPILPRCCERPFKPGIRTKRLLDLYDDLMRVLGKPEGGEEAAPGGDPE